MSRERLAELSGRLRDAAKAQDPIARSVVELVKLKVDALKESLVTADGNDMLRLQGAAREFQKLLRELTTAPPQ